jgi:tetrahydromethanopterin S-methyltransferase subunit G
VRLESLDTRLEKVEDKFDAVAGELLDMRADIGRVKKRLPAA